MRETVQIKVHKRQNAKKAYRPFFQSLKMNVR